MCVPAALGMFRSLFALPEGVAWIGMGFAAVAGRSRALRTRKPVKVSYVVDLTHILTPDFPSWSGYPSLGMLNTHTISRDGFFANAWYVHEHSGTHVDAPLHFSEKGWSAAEIPEEVLIAPAAVMDIRARARRNPDSQVRVEDIKTWERKYGRIPRGAAVLMWSGWEDRVGDETAYRNMDSKGTMHFPGFSPEVAEFLVNERAVAGIGVDTLSLDYGPSTDFGAHLAVLPAKRWGIENLANLGKLPPKGATLFVGIPPVQGASGGPARVLAVW